MRHPARRGDELGGAAEEGGVADGGDHALHVALLGDRTRKGDVAGRLVDRQGFAGQRGLVDRKVGASGQQQIGGHDRPGGDVDDVADDEVGRIEAPPIPVAQRLRLERQTLPQRRERARRLGVLPEAHRGIVNEQACDDERSPASRPAAAK